MFVSHFLVYFAAKGLDETSGVSNAPRRKVGASRLFLFHHPKLRCNFIQRTKPPKPRDASTAMGATPAEATRSMLIAKRSKFSKRINYEAVGALLSDNYGTGKKRKRAPSRTSASADEKDDEEQSDGDGLSGLSGLERMEPDEEDEQRPPVMAPTMGEDYYFDDFEADGYQEEV